MTALMVAAVTVIATAKWQNLSFPCAPGLFSDKADMYNTGGGKNEKTVLLCLTLCLVMSLPLFAEDVAYDAQALDFIEENIEKAFITGKTSYLIEGRMVSEPTDVYNHLELVSYHVEPDGESVILTGTVGEEWVTPVSKVLKTYTREDGSALSADDFKDNLGKKVTLKTKGEEGTNFALRVPSDTVVRVETAWGDVLYTNASGAPHGDGDYLVCNNVDGSADLSDVWVVNGEIFPKTYDMTYAL